MRLIVVAIILVSCATALGLYVSAPTISAEQLLEKSLPSLPASTQLGDVTWLEEHGIGIELDVAPVPTGPFPHLLAGKAVDGKVSFWELGPQGFRRYQSLLESRGGQLSNTEKVTIVPDKGVAEIAGNQTAIKFDNGHVGCVFDFKIGKRHYALLSTERASRQHIAISTAEDLLDQAVVLPTGGQNATCPIFNEGRFAGCLLNWTRNGDRLFKEGKNGWMALRVFQVSLADHASLKDLREKGIEPGLNSIGYKRAGGVMPQIAEKRGFIGEYYKDGDTVERIVYAEMETCWFVGLFKSSMKDRDDLEAEAKAFAESIVRVDLDPPRHAGGMYFGRVRNVNLIVWKDGPTIKWGALFDDSQQRPVLWRQEGVKWNISMRDAGQELRTARGSADSSRELNPLVGASDRALNLPENFKGELEFALTIKGNKATAQLKIE